MYSPLEKNLLHLTAATWPGSNGLKPWQAVVGSFLQDLPTKEEKVDKNSTHHENVTGFTLL